MENAELLEPVVTTEKSKKIVAISKETVHHICSGQVVVDLGVAIKELVENSIDSGATCIDINLVDYGKTSITCIDNGSGVLERDFEGLGLKHHTSKLRDFSDLQDVSTFGFRGEALSSLCSLSDLSITTKHNDNKYAYKLQFDKNGALQKKEICARERGTTVCINNIFKNLPVRFKEFEKNIKKEYAKAVQILQGYCLVSIGVKITCSNTLEKNRQKSVIMTTNGTTNNPLDNALSIFGKKSLNGIDEVQIVLFDALDESICAEFNSIKDEQMPNFTWDFYVSSCEHGMGRSTGDRQFFFVNGRPCNSLKISKLINTLYHKFNNRQYPFVYLNLKLEKQEADVNVTPDKRTIFLTQEKLVLAIIKCSLLNKWEKMQGNFGNAISDQMIQSQLPFNALRKRNFSCFSSESSNGDDDVFKSPSPPTKKKILRSRIICNDNRNDNENNLSVEKNISLNDSDDLIRKQILTDSNSMTTIRSDLSRTIDNKSLLKTEKLSDSIMKINLESIRRAVKLKYELHQNDKSDKKNYEIKFRSEITKNTSDVEDELKKQLTRESFAKMKCLGQFNLGFIIAQLDGDLFIVDQHATDEKYRFEKLNNETKLKTQKLVTPKCLNFTPVNELIAMEHRELFEANGFSLNVDEDGELGKRMKLVGIPVSGNWQFGQADIEELLFLIKEGDSNGINTERGTGILEGNIIRPSKVRQMLASRACRSAVMIGTALNSSEMQRLIMQMGQMSNPWNCPHGRPTIRHLLSLKLLINL